MSKRQDNPFEVHGILEPPKTKKQATPQDELMNFMRLLDSQLTKDDNPEAMVMFGAPKSALFRIRAAMQCGIDALDSMDEVLPPRPDSKDVS